MRPRRLALEAAHLLCELATPPPVKAELGRRQAGSPAPTSTSTAAAPEGAGR